MAPTIPRTVSEAIAGFSGVAFSPPAIVMCFFFSLLIFSFEKVVFINHAEKPKARHGVFHMFHFLLLFVFPFQIYHSPIHKQAESKSVIIKLGCWHYDVITVMSPICIRVLRIISIVLKYLFAVKSAHCLCLFFASSVELNEIGFKFVRKCINYIETKGEGWFQLSVVL